MKRRNTCCQHRTHTATKPPQHISSAQGFGMTWVLEPFSAIEMKRKLKTISDYFEKYFHLSQIHSSVNYAEMKSVRKANRAMDEMTKVANGIISEFDNGLEEYVKLLDSEQMKYYAAFQILNEHLFHQLELPRETENKALEIIKHKAYCENELSYQFWLKDWEEKKKDKKS